MKDHSGMFPVKKMAQVLGISRSRYYSWLKAAPTEHKKQNNELGVIIEQIYHENRGAYGSPRIYRDIKAKGIPCSRKRVARIMREKGLRGCQKRRFKVTTDSRHDFPLAPNLLKRNFTAGSPNRIWVSDITYIWTMEGWLYLCVILDLYSRIAAGWAMDSKMTIALTINALLMAVRHRSPAPGLVFHSDRGVQYAADGFRKRIDEYQMVQSMSRKGDCWDNACAESFFATLKTEEVFHRIYQTRAEAMSCIFEYIAVFYNRKRRHSFIDFVSPEEYESRMACPENVAYSVS
jgi:transposase InsO family protein